MKIHRTVALGMALIMGLVLQAPFCRAQNSVQTEMQRELMNYLEGLSNFSTEWDPFNSELADTVRQLEAYSRMSFRIVPGQSFMWGQAHNGGIILLDISSVHKPRPIMAWKLAHEWGHEALGHAANFYHPAGSQWTFRPTPTSKEDEADSYAGEFLAHFNYPVEPIIDYLNNLPDSGGDLTHSSGPRRAKTVKEAYESYRRRKGVFNIRTRQINCQHRVHFADLYPCTHRAHPADVFPCSHLVRTPFGIAPMHPAGDLFPCQHPLHGAGDLNICTHIMHPGGDTTYTW